MKKSGACAATIAAIAGSPLAAQQVDWSEALGDYSGVSITAAVITDPFLEVMTETSSEFEEATGAKVTVDAFGYGALHDSELLGCSQQADQIDVLVIDGIWIGEFVDAGCLENLDERITAEADVVQWDDFTPAFAEQAVWEGDRYCLPFAAYYQLLFYRHDLFEQAGLTPPSTFAELKEAADFFTDNPDFPGIYGFVTNNARGVAAGQEFHQWLPSAGGQAWASNATGSNSVDAYTDLTPTYTTDAAVGLMQYLKDMLAYGPPGVESYAWDERANAFASGEVAMTNMWSVRATISNNPETSNIVGKFSTAQFPHAEGATSVAPVGGFVICVNKYSDNIDAAWDYVKWFASQEIHTKVARMGHPPSRISTMQDPEVNANFDWTANLFESSKSAYSEVRPRHASTSQLIDTVGIEVNRALIGEVTPAEAMEAANAKSEQMLRRAGLLK